MTAVDRLLGFLVRRIRNEVTAEIAAHLVAAFDRELASRLPRRRRRPNVLNRGRGSSATVGPEAPAGDGASPPASAAVDAAGAGPEGTPPEPAAIEPPPSTPNEVPASSGSDLREIPAIGRPPSSSSRLLTVEPFEVETAPALAELLAELEHDPPLPNVCEAEPRRPPANENASTDDDQVEDGELPTQQRLRIKLGDSSRGATVGGKLTRAERAAGELLEHPGPEARPQSREECRDGPRPCPWVSCAHHLYLDVNPESGSIKLNFPRLEVWEMAESCSLDVADRGGVTLEEVGAILNLTRERIRQVETRGLVRIRHQSGEALGIAPPGPRRAVSGG